LAQAGLKENGSYKGASKSPSLIWAKGSMLKSESLFKAILKN
jgi:hypothetical protein